MPASAGVDNGQMTHGGAPEGATRLTVTVWPGGSAPPQRWQLTCEPSGGDHPDPAAACAALSSVADPFAPIPPDRACAQIYFGPQQARIAGTWRGRPVDAAYARADGCQNERWRALSAVFDAGGE